MTSCEATSLYSPVTGSGDCLTRSVSPDSGPSTLDSTADVGCCSRVEASVQTLSLLSTQELLSLFECPVCYEYILPPAYQCCQGHAICHGCKRKLSHCPSCREELGNIRCLVMEKVGDTIQFPCKYALQGCGLMLHRSRKTTHELEECEYKLFECPYKFIDNCLEWSGRADKVVEHLMLVHAENFKREHGNLKPFEGPVFPLVAYVQVIDYQAENNTTSWMWTALQTCYNAIFVVNIYYVHNSLINVHFVTVRLVDTVDAAKKFQYEIRLEGPNGELSYRGRCHSLHEEVKEIYENRDCLQFDSVTAAKFKAETTVDGARQPVLNLSIKILPLDSGLHEIEAL
ncbi:unnamed protein product [Notodromas monacha]|uniref:E3 ubiquitin-protein ligase n=1 Tax=Notodromas monacha TaxID=399045 RepID=A0A7R9BHM6_9CRUS|nr:unnamed protein product [Notodromas monacha]CAG0915409.1 unnamed protein product [Notodromas monacha]